MKVVSIITICFNERKDIGSTLTSIVKQRGVELEVIVVDGGSSDGTREVLESYRDDVSQIISEPDKGIFDAMNKGLRAATGEWVVFMNAGDEFVDDNVLRTILRKTPEEATVVYGNKRIKNGWRVLPHPLGAIKYGVMPFCHQAALFRRSIGYDLLKFDLRYRIYGDFEVVSRIYSSFPDGFYYIDFDVCASRPGGVSSYATKRKRYEKYLALFKYYGLPGVARGVWGRLRARHR